jgi:hypothetical protein
VSRRIDDKALEKFIADVNDLRSIHTDATISAGMKTNPGNFSSRVNGSKRPGQDFIDRFYQAWGKKLKAIKEEGGYFSDEKIISAAKDSTQDFAYNSPIYLLTEQADRLQRIEESLSQLNTIVSDLMRRLMESNQKLIDAYLSIKGQQTEKSGSLPVEK